MITDAFLEYAGTGSGNTGPLNLTKNGAAGLRLTGTSTYTGTTTVSNGTLQVDGSLGTGPVFVRSGATISGNGTLNGPLTVQNGGRLAPGTGAVGTLTVNGVLIFAGTTMLELEKTGTALTCDSVACISTVNFGGALVVTNIGDVRTGALAPGARFRLFEAGSCTGSFTSIELPELSSGLIWDTNNLAIDGSITVIESSKPPIQKFNIKES